MRFIVDDLKKANELRKKIDKLKISNEKEFFKDFATVEDSRLFNTLLFTSQDFCTVKIFYIPLSTSLVCVSIDQMEPVSKGDIKKYRVKIITDLATFEFKNLSSPEFTVHDTKAQKEYSAR